MKLRCYRVLALVMVMFSSSGTAHGQASDASEVLAREAAPTSITAYGGRVAWSSRRPDGLYALTTYSASGVERVPVRARRGPFDVDLGPDRAGRTVAVYSRCRGEDRRKRSGSSDGQLNQGCDVFRYDFGKRREHRIRTVSTRANSEYLPSIWRDSLAYVRTYPRRPGVRGQLPHLYVSTVPSGGSRRVSSGTRGEYDRFRLDPVEYQGGPGPTALDLRAKTLAYAWSYQPNRCGRFRRRDARGDFRATELWISAPRGRRLLERACLKGQGSSPAFDGPTLNWLRMRTPSTWSLITANGDDVTSAPLSEDSETGVSAIAKDASSLFVVQAARSGTGYTYEIIRRPTPALVRSSLVYEESITPPPGGLKVVNAG